MAILRVPVEVSARHVHLSQKDLERLFGKGHRLRADHSLSQPGQFAARETVSVIKGKKKFEHVRIVGPVRRNSQVELARTDALHLGFDPPVHVSGSLANTPSLTLKGSRGSVKLLKGVIIPQRHIHASPLAAKKAGLRDRVVVSLKLEGTRALTFHNVIVRVHPTFSWHCHIDTDEGNAAGIKKNTTAILIK
ncbi:propanediol utilization protein [Candidatus Uhrbacteria bacterium RIFCSPLOWO2_02_FULL_49_11]|uniref:Phosphate propanoyltransferase n=1 Tax=Candidatus Uhrbacteria bacterium RIFCSPLOWO2_02_FULL_49_11 TaxID=1802409 RepID=A0A1F7VEK0_9BACT|nr:MAG: propanediol utilization protein [Candidatus Uhrbacteria bacterium RIFCSPLOWO2_02_FULL_49_11]